MMDRARLEHAFSLLGDDLVRRGVFVELAVYGACAILLQFDWRRTTEDVDAVVRPGNAESALQPSIALVAEQLELAPDWLNDAVGMFTPLEERDDFFAVAGTYPAGDRPGLRVLVARPHYLLALKLNALASLDRGNKDMNDARALANELCIERVEDLVQVFRSFHGEAPRDVVLRQLPAVLERG